jgi:hypothetical protein
MRPWPIPPQVKTKIAPHGDHARQCLASCVLRLACRMTLVFPAHQPFRNTLAFAREISPDQHGSQRIETGVASAGLG